MSIELSMALIDEDEPFRPNIYLKANALSKAFLWWCKNLITLGNNTTFQQNMHWELRKEEESSNNFKRLQSNWLLYKSQENGIVRACWMTYRTTAIFCFFLSLLRAILQFTGPFLIYGIIIFVRSNNQDVIIAIYLVLAVGLSRILLSLVSAQEDLFFSLLGIRLTNGINAMIYFKSLNISLIQSKDHTTRSLIEHMDIDSQKLDYLLHVLITILIFPLQLAASILILYYLVGLALIPGLCVIIVMGFINYTLGRLYYRYENLIKEKKEARIRIVHEFLNTMKYIKMSGLEESFLQKLNKARAIELRSLAKQYIISCIYIFLSNFLPTLATTAIFGYLALSKNPLSAEQAFTILAIYLILQEQFRSLPRYFKLIFESFEGAKKIDKFLRANEIMNDYVRYELIQDISPPSLYPNAIILKNGNFYWNQEERKSFLKKRKENKPTLEEKIRKELIKGGELEENQEKSNVPNYNDLKMVAPMVISNISPAGYMLPKSEPKLESIVKTVEDYDESQALVSISLSRTHMVPPPPVIGKDDRVLKDINLEIKKGSFTAIIGELESGKSSLLYALIGEMQYKLNDNNDPSYYPSVILKGDICYTPEKPWILNDTIRNNILFGREYDEQEYISAIKYSCLEADLKSLPNNHMTDIGERGFPLNDSLKARISLARAIYSNKDIYLLDDPLNSMEEDVENYIMHNCLLKYLRKKTRVVVMNNLDYLQFTDCIIIMSKGKIIAQGAFEHIQDLRIFQQLLEKNEEMKKEKRKNEENVEDMGDTAKKESKHEEDISIENQGLVKEGKKKPSLKFLDVVRKEIEEAEYSSSIKKDEIPNIPKEFNNNSTMYSKFKNFPPNENQEITLRLISKIPNKIEREYEICNLVTECNKLLPNEPGELMVRYHHELMLERKLMHVGQFIAYENQYYKLLSGFKRSLSTKASLKEISGGQEEEFKISGKNKVYQNIYEPVIIEELRETQVIDWELFKKYIGYYGGIFIFLFIQLVTICWVAIQIISNFWLSKWANSTDKSDKSDQIYYIKYYAIFALGFAGFSLIRALLLFWRSYNCSKKIHNNMMNSVSQAPFNTFFDKMSMRIILDRLTKDLTIIDSYIIFSFGTLLVYFYSMMGNFMVFFCAGSPWIIPFMIVFLGLSLWLRKLFSKIHRVIVGLENISKSATVDFFTETLDGLISIRAFGKQDTFFQKHIMNLNENIKNQVLISSLSNWLSIYVTIFSLLISIPITTICVILKIEFDFPMSPGIAGLLMIYALNINNDVVSFLWLLSDFENKMVSFERCVSFEKIHPEGMIRNQNPEWINNLSKIWPNKGEIQFLNYSVKYGENLPVALKRVTFKIHPKEKIAILGRTDSGKSAVFLAILRLLEPETGKIIIDDVDIETLGLYDLRQRITIISQNPMLFKGTIRENLDIQNEFSDAEIWRALEIVDLKSKFQAEYRLDTEVKREEIGEQSPEQEQEQAQEQAELSPYEKQLIYIARGILKKTKIMLIDEVTSKMDKKSENGIMDIVKKALKDCTVLIIAHRSKTIVQSDRILIFDDGKVAEFDTPDQLLMNKNQILTSVLQRTRKESNAPEPTSIKLD